MAETTELLPHHDHPHPSALHEPRESPRVSSDGFLPFCQWRCHLLPNIWVKQSSGRQGWRQSDVTDLRSNSRVFFTFLGHN